MWNAHTMQIWWPHQYLAQINTFYNKQKPSNVGQGDLSFNVHSEFGSRPVHARLKFPCSAAAISATLVIIQTHRQHWHNFRDLVGDPLQFPMLILYWLHHVSFLRYLPLNLSWSCHRKTLKIGGFGPQLFREGKLHKFWKCIFKSYSKCFIKSN